MSKKICEVTYNALLDAIREELKKDGDVSIDGFGTFFVRKPAAGQPLMLGHRRVPPKPVFKPDGALRKEMVDKNPYFKPGKFLKDAVNKPINKYDHCEPPEWRGW